MPQFELSHYLDATYVASAMLVLYAARDATLVGFDFRVIGDGSAL